MLNYEGQTQHWMKTADWENPERALELKPGEPPAILYAQAWTISGSLC